MVAMAKLQHCLDGKRTSQTIGLLTEEHKKTSRNDSAVALYPNNFDHGGDCV
jgi:hypothetical protein